MRLAQPLDSRQRRQLHRLKDSSGRLAVRAQIVLLAGNGQSDAEIASELGLSRKTVWRWRTRYSRGGVNAIRAKPARRGRKPTLRHQLADRILAATRMAPPDDIRRWSTRSLAHALGVSRGMIHRVWREHGVQVPQGRTQRTR